MSESDSELLVGDGDQFRRLVLAHAAGVHRYLAARVGSQAAEDISSEVFLAAFAGRARFDPERGSLRAWLFGIATNLARQHHRAEARMLRAYARVGADADARGADEDVVFDARHARLAGVLSDLRPDHRAALLLTAVVGLSAEDAAVAMGVPSSTLRAWVARARQHASRALETSTPVVSQGRHM